jgi:very-short-patch-repair endonuclease
MPQPMDGGRSSKPAFFLGVRIPPGVPNINTFMEKKEQYKTNLVEYYEKTGKIPTITLTASELGVSPTVVRKAFGTWNVAIEYCGFETRKKRDKINVTCSQCGHTFKRRWGDIRSDNVFCSKSCATTFNNLGSTQTETTKQKISETLQWKRQGPPKPFNSPNSPEYKLFEKICAECDGVFSASTVNRKKKFCSPECHKNNASKRMSKWLSENRSHVRGPHKQSYMESSFEEWLTSKGMGRGVNGYLTEVYFFNKQTKKNGWADFVFPRKRLIIELDGTHHRKRKHLDKQRDDYLRSKGWNVLRISHREYLNKTKQAEVESLLF